VLQLFVSHDAWPEGERLLFQEVYWEELLDGKYEWSSIGKQLLEKGLVA
jgi:hypothetical protein